MRNRSFVWLLASVLSVSVWAQHYTTLDWDVLSLDSVLPVYTEVVPLETDYRNYDYSVEVSYPQYALLSGNEEKTARRFAQQLADSLKLETSVGAQRGEGLLDISFVPVIKKGERFYKLQSARFQIVSTPKPLQRRIKTRAASETYTKQSVLSTGKWVKISVTQDGIYQLTRSALRSMGFSKPENVRLYGYGGYVIDESLASVCDDLCEVPLYYNAAKDNFLFWANGLVYWRGETRVFNPYANEACYFLTEAAEPGSIPTATFSGAATQTFDAYTDHLLYEKDNFAWHLVGRNLYDAQDFATGGHSYQFTTVNSMGNESLTVAFTAGANEQTTLQTTVNGNALPETKLGAIGKYIYATTSNIRRSISSYSNGAEWNIRLSSTAGNPAHLDYLAFHYQRALKLDEGYIAFSQSSSDAATFHITAPEGAVVMQIPTPEKPGQIIPTTRNGAQLQAKVENASLRYVCFNPASNFPQPNVVGNVENQNLHALDSLDMVIIVPASGKLIKEATRLADAHSLHDGLRTAVVRADQVYNEFSSGTPDATAYRRLMKMIYDRARDKADAPRYLLLMGACAWDNRMLSTIWQGYNPNDYLLCYESDNSVTDTRSYVMEDYFALLDDGEGRNLLSDKPDLGVGRFPVTVASEARVMVDKAIAYMENRYAGAWKNLVCFLGDDGDDNEHMQYADEVASQVEKQHPEIEVRKVMWDAYSRVSTAKNNTYPEVEKFITRQMKEGALVFNFTGHAHPLALSHEFSWEIDDFANAENTALPLWFTAACDVMPFDNRSANQGSTAVLNPKGGAVAFVGTTRTVYAAPNRLMNLQFMRHLFATDKGRRNRLGDALRLAKNGLITDGEGSFRENKLQYTLLGDPALIIGAPKERVVVDQINGTALDKDTQLTLRAGDRVKVCGHLNDAAGAMMSQFSGEITCRVFDTPMEVTCHNNARAKSPFKFIDRSSLLYNRKDSVKSGRFEFEFTVPIDMNYGAGSGRMLFYALSNDHLTEANGYCESFTFDAAEHALTDQVGPEITAFLVDDNFQDGATVPQQPLFMANLSDASGVNTSGNGIGHHLSLCIDGRNDMTYNLNDYYIPLSGNSAEGTLAYTLPSLEDGPHTLTFRAWDVLNNTSTTSLNFVIDSKIMPSMMQFAASPVPAVQHTTFMITHDRPGADCTFTIEVFDTSGRKLWSHVEHTPSAPAIYTHTWNLTSSFGGRLGSGIYFSRCTMRCGNGHTTAAKSQKLVVLNNK